MVSFLFRVTPFDDLSPDERIELLVATISNDLYGMSHFSMIEFKPINLQCHYIV